jgi:hypothetical protein
MSKTVIKNKLPKIAAWLLTLFSTNENKFSMIGDIEEDYEDVQRKKRIAHLLPMDRISSHNFNSRYEK